MSAFHLLDIIKQPNEFTCGHACLAMLTRGTLDEVFNWFSDDDGIAKSDMCEHLVRCNVWPVEISSGLPNLFPFEGYYLISVPSMKNMGHWMIVINDGHNLDVIDPNVGAIVPDLLQDGLCFGDIIHIRYIHNWLSNEPEISE